MNSFIYAALDKPVQWNCIGLAPGLSAPPLPAFMLPSPPALNYVHGMQAEKAIYLDHAAGTWVYPEVKAALSDFLDQAYLNPSSIHRFGRAAAAILDTSRRRCASIVGATPGELIFTSGGTEANHLALHGIAKARQTLGKHIISSKTEHASTLESLNQLAAEGFEVDWIEQDAWGRVDPLVLQTMLRDDTILVSLMWINNETGIIQNIPEIGRLLEAHTCYLHCDAVQALGHLPLDLRQLPVDSMSFSGHKIGATAGSGMLFLRKGRELQPQISGGAQEFNHRGGTQNLLGVFAFAAALEVSAQRLPELNSHYAHLKNKLVSGLSTLPGYQLNQDNGPYAEHILNCSFHSVDGEALFIRLDMHNIAVSNGSACTSGSQAPSHVLTALGFKKSLAQASIRVSLGRETKDTDIEQFIAVMHSIIHDLYRAA